MLILYYLNYPVKVSIASLKPIGFLSVNPCQGHAESFSLMLRLYQRHTLKAFRAFVGDEECHRGYSMFHVRILT